MAPISHNTTHPVRALRSTLACLLAVLAGAAGAAGAAAEKKPGPSQSEIQVEAKSSEVDYKNHTIDYTKVKITQDDITVQADRAHAAGDPQEKSEWTFEGNVRVDSEQRGSLHSDHAVVEIQSNRLVRVTVNGMPAEFEQKRAGTDQVTRGHAEQIVYDVSNGIVQLSKDAWISLDAHNEISSALLVYDMRGQKLKASTPNGDDGRVHMTITPGDKTETKKQP
jgi:lipopolysaccharide transport protein LptA